MRSVVVLALLAACRPPGWGRHDVDAAQATGDSPKPADASPDTPAARTCDHPFRLTGYGTHSSAWVTGDFVHWAGTPQAGALAMTLGVDGAWTASHTFDGGSYQYKFIIDGTTWILDPTNPTVVDDGHGNQNSVYTCMP